MKILSMEYIKGYLCHLQAEERCQGTLEKYQRDLLRWKIL